MSAPLTEVADHTPHAPAAPPPTGWRRWLLGPGFVRAAWMTALFFGIGFVIVVGLRSLAGYEPVYDWLIIVTIAGLITAPIGFLAGIGAFDYWVYYALGYPTRPEDHSGHGARMVMIVTRKLSAVMIDDAPAHWTPMLNQMFPSVPTTESGA